MYCERDILAGMYCERNIFRWDVLRVEGYLWIGCTVWSVMSVLGVL